MDKMEIVAVESMPHDLLSLHPGWAEEDALIWKENLFALLSKLSREYDLSALKAIGLTGMVPALISLDKDGNPLRNSIQQNDMRTKAELDELKAEFEADDDSYFKTTGSHINSQHIAPRLLWIKKNEPEVFSKIANILGSYDYGAYILTGKMHIEANWALESGLFSLDGKLIKEVIKYVGLPESVLPEAINSYGLCDTISDMAAKATGLPKGVRVYAGTADHVASAFCTGAHQNGDLVLKLGGAGDILLSLDHLVIDDRLFCLFRVSIHNQWMHSSKWFFDQMVQE